MAADDWRDFPGAPGYQVNSDGQFKRLARTDRLGRHVSEQVLSGHVDPWGYVRYFARGKVVKGHRAVLETFVGPCPPGMEGCHNNGNPADNRLENLRWDTRQNNMIDKVNHGAHPMASKTHCKHGHAFTPENTRLATQRGANEAVCVMRTCRTCAKERSRKHRERKKLLSAIT